MTPDLKHIEAGKRFKAYSGGEGFKQYSLDLLSTYVLLQAGFVNHPRFNELVKLGDPREYYELVLDEFRQLNTYMIDCCIEHDIVRDGERYTNPILRQMFIECGQNYAEVFFEKTSVPNWDQAKELFDRLMNKYYNV